MLLATLLVGLGLAQAAPKPASARKPAVSKPAPSKPAEHLCPGGEAGSRRVSVNGQCVAPVVEKVPAAPPPAPNAAPPPTPRAPVVVATPIYVSGYRGPARVVEAPAAPSRPGLRDCQGLGSPTAEIGDWVAPVLLVEDRSLLALVEAGSLAKACQRLALDDDSPAAIAWYNLAVLRDLGGQPAAGLVALARAEEIGLPAGVGEAAAALLLAHAQSAARRE